MMGSLIMQDPNMKMKR